MTFRIGCFCQCQTIYHAKLHYQPKNYFPSIKNTRSTVSPVLEVLDAPYCRWKYMYYYYTKSLNIQWWGSTKRFDQQNTPLARRNYGDDQTMKAPHRNIRCQPLVDNPVDNYFDLIQPTVNHSKFRCSSLQTIDLFWGEWLSHWAWFWRHPPSFLWASPSTWQSAPSNMAHFYPEKGKILQYKSHSTNRDRKNLWGGGHLANNIFCI